MNQNIALADFNLTRIQSIISRIELDSFFISVKLSATISSIDGHVRLVANYSLPDNYGPYKLARNFNLTNDETKLDVPEPILVRAVRNLVAIILLHELDEKLCLDGKRFHDPHPNGETSFSVCVCPDYPCKHLK